MLRQVTKGEKFWYVSRYNQAIKHRIKVIRQKRVFMTCMLLGTYKEKRYM